MKLLDKLRSQPEWQSQDPEVRLAAVRGLPEGDDGTQKLLIEIVRHDDDPTVRREAVVRIDDIDVIGSIVDADTDPAVRSEATGVLRERVIEAEDFEQAERGLRSLSDQRDLVTVARSARLESVSRTALSRLTDPKALGTVARRSTSIEIATEALSRLDDTDQLLSVAVKAEDRAIAVRAFERLTAGHMTREVLEQLGKRAKQKSVRRRASAALSALDEALLQASSSDEHATVCERLEAMASENSLERGRQILDAVLTQWSTLDVSEDEAIKRRFADARSAAERRLAELESASTADRRGDEVFRHAIAEREALCARAEEMRDSVSGDGLQALRDQWAGLAVDIETAVDQSHVRAQGLRQTLAQLGERFERAIAVCEDRRRQHFAALLRLAEMERIVSQIEKLAGTGDVSQGQWAALDKALSEITGELNGRVVASGAKDFVDRLNTLQQRLESAQEQRRFAAGKAKEARARSETENLARVLQRGRTVEGLVGSDKLRLSEAERQLRALKRLINDPGPLPSRDREATLRKLRHAHTVLLGRVRELRDFADWQRWANLGVQDQLCRRMESLAQATTGEAGVSGDEAELAKRFLDIKARWRDVSDVPEDRGAEIRDRFTAAHDVVSRRCQAYFEAQEAERQENLARQVAMVEEAEQLASSTDWLRSLNRITALQAELKTLGPVPRREQRELWKRFRAACNSFFARRKVDLAARKKEWSRNLELKVALIERVEALGEADDLAAAVADVKRAQADWKGIGPVRRNKSDALWARFRTACDRVFGRIRAEEHAAAAERVAVRESLCVELEGLLPTVQPSDPSANLAAQVQDLQRRWKEAPEIPAEFGRRLSVRFGDSISRLVETYPESFNGTALDPARKLKRLEALCNRIEALRPTTVAESDASPAEILAAKWRDALASNLMGARVDEASERRSALDEVRRARADCRRLGGVAGEDGRRLLARFHAACDRVQSWAQPERTRPARERPRPRRDTAGESKTARDSAAREAR